MPNIPFLLQHVVRKDIGLPGGRCVNLYPEAAPTSPRSDVVLRSFPGLEVVDDLSGTELRGIYQKDGVLDGRLYLVIDSEVKAKNTDGTIEVLEGSLSESAGVVAFAGDSDELMMVSGGKLYRITAEAVTAVTTYDDGESALPLINDIAYINGWFLYAFATGEFAWSRVSDGDTINALDFATAEYSPDALIGILVEREQVQLFNRETVENWTNTGGADAAFQRRPGGSHETGLIGPLAKTVANNSFYWVGEDGLFYRMGETPQAVGSDTLHEIIADCEEAGAAQDITVWNMTWRGRVFIMVDVPGQGTHCLDAKTQTWRELSTWDKPLYRGFDAVKHNGVHYVADRYACRLLKLTRDVETEPDGLPIEYVATALVRKVQRGTRLSSLVLLGRKGARSVSGDAPKVMARVSFDAGHTFGTERVRDLGKQGDRNARAKFTKMGKVKDQGALVEFRVTDGGAILRLDGALFNE